MDIALSGHYGYRRLLRTAAPCVAMMLVSSVYGIVDGLFVSNFAGTTGFAAVNLMWPAIMVLGALGMMVGSGGAALVGKIKGEGYPLKADRVFTMLVRFLGCTGVAVGVLFAIFAPTIARWLGADDAMAAEAVVYSRICMAGMPFFMMQNAFQSFYMAAERPQLGTWMSVASGVVNIVFDALFVALLGWGVAGAAVATTMAQVVGGGFPLLYFSVRRINRGTLHLMRGSRTIWPYIGQACTNGLSEYVGGISLSLVSICYNLQLMRYLGENGVAAYGVVMYISFVLAAFFIGYNIALTPVVGYHYGAGDLGEQRSLLRKSLVIIFGVGGVGSWCAEGLVRSGIMDLTLVDPDEVSVTNINRQLMATTSTVGRPKVLALKDRLLDINPQARINALELTYGEETSGQFDLDSYDYIIDAVDSLKNKILLILNASASKATFFCSMGAALKIDPCRVKVAEFWSVRGCPLGAMIRKKIRKAGVLPKKKFLCVYDDEVLPNRGKDGIVETDTFNKAQINGTIASVTAIFGMTLSGLVIKDIYKRNAK